jgi:predicted SprT family Zn-dependent metalloprotease
MKSTSFRKATTSGTASSIHSFSGGRTHTPAPELHAFALEKLRALGLHELAVSLVVVWNSRMRSTAGLAYPSSTQIMLNPKLIHFGTDEVERTLLHELAHLIAHHRGGRRRIAPHGEEWRLACLELGLANEARCHNLPLPRRKMARTCIYQCPKCKTQLARVRAFRRPAACMSCCRSQNGGRYDERFKLVRLV